MISFMIIVVFLSSTHSTLPTCCCIKPKTKLKKLVLRGHSSFTVVLSMIDEHQSKRKKKGWG